MKEGITSIDIEPVSNYIDFLGATSDPSISFDSKTLKGNISFSTSKAIKVKAITIKFKGESTIFESKTQDQYQYEIKSSIFPKLKSKVYEKSSVFTPGEHVLPWELEIPNIYPMSVSNKRCMINYKVQVKISLGINKTITAYRTIIVRRHLLESLQAASLVGSKSFEYTFANGFYYCIEVPKIVCIEQAHLPIAIKFNHVEGTSLEYISTQITQVEIYRCRHISKAEADVAINNKRNGAISLYELHAKGDSGLIKYIRPLQPIIKNSVNHQEHSPLVLEHPLEPKLNYCVESPLIAISHQLDVVFYFGAQHDEVRVKIPIIVSSVPTANNDSTLTLQHDSTSLKKSSSIRTIKESLKVPEPLKKSVSDQDLLDSRRRSISEKDSKSKSDETMHSSFNALIGLHPPPRRARKKEVSLALTNIEKYTPKSRSSSPISPRTPKYSIPDQPMTPLRRQFLNQSKSSCTASSTDYPLPIKKRANSIDHFIPYDYDHYVSAELPPIPPAITQQQLPSIPIDKNEHRKTRMYYDDESDEEDLLF